MQWYYAIGKERLGPMEDDEFAACVADGRITAKTLVWNNSLSGWTRLSALPDYPGKVQDTDLILEAPVPDLMPEPAQDFISGQARCSECGILFPEEDLVHFGDTRVCAGCKPLFVQKIREGVSVGSLVYAGFWIRFAAKFIDGLILGVVNMILSFILGFLVIASVDDPTMAIKYSVFTMFLQIAIAAGYSSLFLGRFGATPGKMACGLKVITAEQNAVTYMRGFGRYFGELVSGFTLCIGYIMAGWDPEKRALHDRICNTRVIRVRHY